MWKLLIGSVGEIFKSWVGLKKAKHEAEAARAMKLAQTEADYDLEAQRNMRSSWKDEIITIIWFGPLVVAWVDQERASEWIAFVIGLPVEWWFVTYGIIAATFGLRWYFKRTDFKGITTGKDK